MKKYFLMIGALGLVAGLTVNAQLLGTRQSTANSSVSTSEVTVATVSDRLGGLISNSSGSSTVSCFAATGTTFDNGIEVLPGNSITFGFTPSTSPAGAVYQGAVHCIGNVTDVTNTVTAIQIIK